MSENTTTTQDANGTGIPTAITDPDQVAAFIEYQRKEKERKDKLAAAAAERKRQNNRGKMPDGTTDRNPAQAYLAGLAELLRNWTTSYAADPAQVVRRLNEQLIPSITAASNTASTQMGAGMDTRRADMREWHAVSVVPAPEAPKQSTK